MAVHGTHLSLGHTLDDILKHPAFAGFAALMLPSSEPHYDATLPLEHIGSLLPYHSDVKPGVVVSSLNRLFDDANIGRTVFYDIYTDGEKRADPSKKETGLFFFRGRPGDISPTSYSRWGSSAGARMAALVGSHGAERFGGANLPTPATVVLLYTGHSDVGRVEPPTFAAVGEDDRIAPPAVMERRVAALRRQGTEVEYRKYAGVGHGFGLFVGITAEGWIGHALRFWEKHARLQRSPRTSRRDASNRAAYSELPRRNTM